MASTVRFDPSLPDFLADPYPFYQQLRETRGRRNLWAESAGCEPPRTPTEAGEAVPKRAPARKKRRSPSKSSFHWKLIVPNSRNQLCGGWSGCSIESIKES